jgi:hypothetical protein
MLVLSVFPHIWISKTIVQLWSPIVQLLDFKRIEFFEAALANVQFLHLFFEVKASAL